MHRAGALVGGDIPGEHAQDLSFEKRMEEDGPLQPASRKAGDFPRILQPAFLHGLPRQGGGDDEDLVFMFRVFTF